MLLAVSFFGLTRSKFCFSGRLSSEPADFAAVLLAASVLELTRSHLSLSGRMPPEPADFAVVLLARLLDWACVA